MKKNPILAVFVVGIGIFILFVMLQKSDFQPVNNADNSFETLSANNTIALETSHLAHLKPHKHEMGDKISHSGHHHDLTSEPISFPEDVWITNFNITLHNAPASVVHHINLLQLDKRSNTCPNQLKELLVAGEDAMHNSTLSFPEPYGMLIEAGSLLLLASMIHNPLPPVGVGGEYEDVYITLDIDYELVEKSNRSKSVEFYLMHLEDTPCQGRNYDFTVPANTETFVRREDAGGLLQPGRITMPFSGKILYAGGHLHGWEGGKFLRVYKNGELFEEFETRPSEEQQYVWNTDHSVRAEKVEKGDVLEIEAEYQNLTDIDVIGAMGMYAFFVAPDDI